MNHIHFITTGGTIDKAYATQTEEFIVDTPAVVHILEQIPSQHLNYTISEVSRSDTNPNTHTEREELRQACMNAPSDRIIITTDLRKILDTAEFLSDVFTTKTIILTGSTIPASSQNSDAELNIGTALGAADILPQGTHIAVDGQIHKPRELVNTEEKGLVPQQ